MALDPDLLLLRDDGEEEFGVWAVALSGAGWVRFLLGSGSQPS